MAVERGELDGRRPVAQAGDADRARIDDTARHQLFDSLLDHGQHVATIGKGNEVAAIQVDRIGRLPDAPGRRWSLHAEHDEAVIGKELDREFVAGTAAQKAPRLILHDDQRIAVDGSIASWKHDVSKGRNADIAGELEALDRPQG
jgi:hypothetical protein